MSLSGFWRTQSGAVYKFSNEAGQIIGLYWIPSASQTASGFVQGDLAFKGTLIGRVLVGSFHQRFHLEDKGRCPGSWDHYSSLYLQISGDDQEMDGVLLSEHLSENDCIIDDRRLVTLVFSRVSSDKVETEVEVGGLDEGVFENAHYTSPG